MSNEVFKKYIPEAFNYITANKNVIAQAARDLGVSATGIGAAIAKEQDAYESKQGAVRFFDRRLDDYVKLQTFRVGDIQLRGEAAVVTQYGLDEQLKGTAGKALKFVFPTLADVGIANIKVSTAIKLLDDYLAKYPADPLGLKKYQTDAGRFVRDLIDPREPTTALVSALMIKEAQDFYLKPSVDAQGHQLSIDPASWGAMSQEVRDGLTTMYFTMGKNVMDTKRADNIARNGVYDPRLGKGDSGGLWTVQNAAEIGSALGVTGYGQAPINRFTLEPSTTFINLPNSGAGTSDLISYASDYSVRINQGGTLSHIVAAEAAKGNAISVEDLRAVNYDLQGVADTAIPSGAVLLVPKLIGDSLVVDSGNARISFNATTGEYLAITTDAAAGGTFIYERKLVDGKLVDRFIQSDSAINGLDLTDGNPTTLPISVKTLADHTGSLTMGDERGGNQLTTLASHGDGNYQITAEVGGRTVALNAVADTVADGIRVTGLSSIGGQPLDHLGTGTYNLTADDYLSYGLTFDNLVNGNVPQTGVALITGLNPATQAANGWPAPQVVESPLPQGFTRTLELGNGVTLTSTYNDDRRLISVSETTAYNSIESSTKTYTINADGSRTGSALTVGVIGADGVFVGQKTDLITNTVYKLIRSADGQETMSIDTDASENLIASKGIGMLNDITSLITAIKGGQPLPTLSSGLTLINNQVNQTVDGAYFVTNPQLSTVTGVVGGLASLYNLSNALENGDTLTQVSATLNTLNYVTSTLPRLLGTSAPLSAGLNGLLNGSSSGLMNGGAPGVLPVLGLVMSIRSGDPVGIATSMIGLINPALLATSPVGWIVAGVQILSALMNEPPEAWGSARLVFDANGQIKLDAVGEGSGTERVRQQLQGTLDVLNSMVAQAQAGSPGNPLGIVPQRMPTITWREARQDDKGYAITDIDPISGEQRYPYLRWDDAGVPFSSQPGLWQPDPGDPYIRASFNQHLAESALAREAIAAQWEVDTARIQQDVGDPNAGLSEAERAARMGLGATYDPVTKKPVGQFRAVALDLDGDGQISTAAKEAAGNDVAFDWDDSGYLKQVAWVQPNDAYLFLDRNLNGVVDSGKELFSNSLVSDDYKGVRSLSAFDASADGRIHYEYASTLRGIGAGYGSTSPQALGVDRCASYPV